MEAWERRKILGEWGVRGENPRERLERRALERDVSGSPLAGGPLQPRPRNFKPSPDSYVASLGGPLPYMLRLREIYRATEEAERELGEAWRELARACTPDAAAFARRWRAVAGRWDFGAVNELIDRHNRYYPAEARLPMDVRRRDYVLVNGEPYWRRPLGVSWVLERFPAALAEALAAAA